MLTQLDALMAFSAVMLILSLVVTALVQAVSELLDLRGRNLVAALATLLRHVAPQLEPHAAQVAETLARHPTLASGGSRRAVVVRAEELARLLERLAVADDTTWPEGSAVKESLRHAFGPRGKAAEQVGTGSTS